MEEVLGLVLQAAFSLPHLHTLLFPCTFTTQRQPIEILPMVIPSSNEMANLKALSSLSKFRNT